MSRRRAILTEYEVKRILSASVKAGITMGIVVTTEGYTFLPVDEIKNMRPASSIEDWKAKRNARKEKT